MEKPLDPSEVLVEDLLDLFVEVHDYTLLIHQTGPHSTAGVEEQLTDYAEQAKELGRRIREALLVSEGRAAAIAQLQASMKVSD